MKGRHFVGAFCSIWWRGILNTMTQWSLKRLTLTPSHNSCKISQIPSMVFSCAFMTIWISIRIYSKYHGTKKWIPRFLQWLYNKLKWNQVFTWQSEKSNECYIIHFLLFITRKYTIINAHLKLINGKIHSFYSIDIHYCTYAIICIKGHSIAPTDDH